MSDISPVEQMGTTINQPKVEQPLMTAPKKITEQYINAVVKDVIRKAEQEREKSLLQPKIELTPDANNRFEDADTTVIRRLMRFPKKGLEIAKTYYKQAVLTSASLAALIESGCGNVENPNIHATNIPEPTPASATLPENTTYNTDILQPYATQASEQKENKELESPEDLIPEKELKERFGIKIFQLKGNIELGFRRGAEKDRLFHHLEKTRDNHETYIILFDGPYLDPKFLTTEQKAALQDDADRSVLESLSVNFLPRLDESTDERRKWFEEKKNDKVAEYNKLLHELESKRSMLSEDRYEVEHQALDYQYAPFVKGPTNEDLINAGEISLGGNTGRLIKKNGKDVYRYYVLLAVKDMERTKKFKVGNEEIEVLKPGFENKESSWQLTPDPSQSYPSPDRFTIDRSHPIYPIRKGWTPGIIARHELRHLTGLPHPQADLDLVSDIETAYENYKNNSDDSGFWVVFKTLKGPVITEKITPEAKNTAQT